MTDQEKLASMELAKAVRKAKKRRDALTVFACMIPVILWAMHPVVGVVALAAPMLVWRTINKTIQP